MIIEIAELKSLRINYSKKTN